MVDGEDVAAANTTYMAAGIAMEEAVDINFIQAVDINFIQAMVEAESVVFLI